LQVYVCRLLPILKSITLEDVVVVIHIVILAQTANIASIAKEVELALLARKLTPK
jgi:hypothetical protein